MGNAESLRRGLTDIADKIRDVTGTSVGYTISGMADAIGGIGGGGPLGCTDIFMFASNSDGPLAQNGYLTVSNKAVESVNVSCYQKTIYTYSGLAFAYMPKCSYLCDSAFHESVESHSYVWQIGIFPNLTSQDGSPWGYGPKYLFLPNITKLPGWVGGYRGTSFVFAPNVSTLLGGGAYGQVHCFPNASIRDSTPLYDRFQNWGGSRVMGLYLGDIDYILSNDFANYSSGYFRVLDLTRCTKVPTLSSWYAFSLFGSLSIYVPASLYPSWSVANEWRRVAGKLVSVAA